MRSSNAFWGALESIAGGAASLSSAALSGAVLFSSALVFMRVCGRPARLRCSELYESTWEDGARGESGKRARQARTVRANVANGCIDHEREPRLASLHWLTL